MTPPVTFTLDIEDLRTSPHQELRFPRATHRVLDLLADHGARASVYIVGELVGDHRGLVKRIHDAGHEVGLHSWRHVPLVDLSPDDLRDGIRRGKAAIEDITGEAVLGYRAPMMSLVPQSSWAIDLIAEAGFVYSTSALPAQSPMYGWPGLPREPFRWDNGLIELPCPVVEIAGTAMPFLGGTYLRVLPDAVRRTGMRRSSPSEVLWAYCHPWEFDPDEPFFRYDHSSWLTSRIGWVNRRGMERRIARVLAGGSGAPLGDIAADPEFASGLPVVDIADAAREPGPDAASVLNRLFRNVDGRSVDGRTAAP